VGRVQHAMRRVSRSIKCARRGGSADEMCVESVSNDPNSTYFSQWALAKVIFLGAYPKKPELGITNTPDERFFPVSEKDRELQRGRNRLSPEKNMVPTPLVV
jgi:hypothetical protein